MVIASRQLFTPGFHQNGQLRKGRVRSIQYPVLMGNDGEKRILIPAGRLNFSLDSKPADQPLNFDAPLNLTRFRASGELCE